MKKNNVFWRFVFGAGVVCAFLPLMGAWKEGIRANESIQGYEKTVESLNEASIDENWQLLEAYNESLRSNLSWIEYEKVKERFLPSDIIGYLSIPSIEVRLPIFLGSEEEHLKEGVGHVARSSLPVGGVSSRALLTGHSGLANGRLFSRLDELERGDFFLINVLGRELAYQVERTEMILPQEVERLNIEEGRDLVSLITCAPFGINTHRLIVTGERVEEENRAILLEREVVKVPSWRALVLSYGPIGLSIVFGWMWMKGRKKG